MASASPPAAGAGLGACEAEKSAAAPPMWSLDDFELGRRLGAGSFGYAQFARERRTGAEVVLKTMGKRRVEKLRAQKHVSREVGIQAHLRHPHVLRLHAFFWDASRLFLVLELARGGDLGRLLRRQPRGAFDGAVASLCVAQVVQAVVYLHELSVLHRDINPRNVLVGRGMRLKLADFGAAVHTRPGDPRWTVCGTLDYLPPEMVEGKDGHSFGVDVWAVGILSFELLAGLPPFAAPSREETYRSILGPETYLTFPEAVDEPAARDFVARLLRREPQERPPLADVAAHAWLGDMKDAAFFERAVAALGGA